jgi:hypothetical protein
MLCLALPCIAQAAAPPAEMSGKITRIQNGHVTIRDNNEREVILLGLNAAHIINGVFGYKMSFADLTVGLPVTAYHSLVTTRSLPPQANAIALVIGTGNDVARYFPVAEVTNISDGMVRVLNSQNDLYLTIKDDVLPYPAAQLKAGSELLAWYNIIAMSMPGQATPNRVQILHKQRPDIIVNLTAGVIAAGGQEIHLNFILDQKDSLFLPLHIVAEALGYLVSWQTNENSAVLKREDGKTFTLTVGSHTYSQSAPPFSMVLYAVPCLVDGVMYVPMEAFGMLMGHRWEINRNHV